MKFIYLSLVLFTCLSCNNNGINNDKIVSQNNSVESNAPISYDQFVAQILKTKRAHKEKWRENFYQYVNTDIPNYWIGTTWDFNGVTQTPKTGQIACGYFITNTLAAYGITLRRAYLAQQVSAKMISTLCSSNSIERFTSILDLENYVMNRSPYEIYIVGLDFHTSYIIREDANIYFLHANYIERKGVIKEKMKSSKALNQSKSFVIGSLSNNDQLFK